MSENGVIILNPTAARGRAERVWPRVRSVLRAALPAMPAVWESRAPGHAMELAQQAAAEGYPWVAVCGGDGTIHEVVNGLCRFREARGGEAPLPRLAVIPAGTGNDFARSMGLPRDPVTAVTALTRGRPVPIDVGRAGDRYFANAGGAGFDAEVAADVNRRGKRTGGALPYVTSALRTLLVYRNQPVEIGLDDRVLQRRVLLVVVGVGGYYGGGMRVLPGADPRDGLFDVCICSDISRAAVLGLMVRVFWGGHAGHPKVEMYRARRVRVTGPEHLNVHADGELVGRLPVEFTCLPGALEVLYPDRPDART